MSDPAPSLNPWPTLTDTERAILDFEDHNQWWKYGGAKEAAVRDQFDMSTVRYYAVLGELLKRPEALEYAPGTVRRLVRLREARRGQRTAG